MKCILSLLVVLSFSAYAQKGNGKGFEERKAKAVEHISKRIAVLETAKSCISSAADREALKACRKAQKSSMDALKSERKQWRSERKQKRAERKAKKKNEY